MKKKVIRASIIIGPLLLIAGAAMLGICARNKFMNHNNASAVRKEINIAVVDSGKFAMDNEEIAGVFKFVEDNKENIKIKLAYYDDDENYVQGLILANKLSKDSNTDMVITFQRYETIEAIAPIFSKAEKPLIIARGSYDKIAKANYKNILIHSVEAKVLGQEMGKYLVSNGYKRIAVCHSDMTFERGAVMGLQRTISRSKTSDIYLSQVGPTNENDLADFIVQCRKLKIDAVTVGFSSIKDNVWLVKRIRQELPDMQIIGDYDLVTEYALKKLGKLMNGVIIVPDFPFYEWDDTVNFLFDSVDNTNSTNLAKFLSLFKMIDSEAEEDGRLLTGMEILGRIKKNGFKDGDKFVVSYDEYGCLLAGDGFGMLRFNNGKYEKISEYGSKKTKQEKMGK